MSLPAGPQFIIIGAMKCATTTLHEQLALQPGFFMTEPKEPSFFSDDDQYARGLDWYRSLFTARGDAAFCGESSTNYTKLPDFPRTVERMQRHLPDVRLIYIMRHPIERLVSHYVHEWSLRNLREPIDQAVDRHRELVNYGRYALQLQPYLDAFGASSILPVFFERLVTSPQEELDRIFAFLGASERGRWVEERAPRNVSRDRIQRHALRDALIWNPLSTWIRRTFIPQSWRERVKNWYRMRERPVLSAVQESRLAGIFDEDLALLGRRLGQTLSCSRWHDAAAAGPLRWVV